MMLNVSVPATCSSMCSTRSRRQYQRQKDLKLWKEERKRRVEVEKRQRLVDEKKQQQQQQRVNRQRRKQVAKQKAMVATWKNSKLVRGLWDQVQQELKDRKSNKVAETVNKGNAEMRDNLKRWQAKRKEMAPKQQPKPRWRI